jgi:dTDP-4-amino-4,6-dideoxygalactose transaminase
MQKILFHKTHTTDEEINAVVEVMKSGWLTMGPKTIEFENNFKKYVGAPEAVSVNSATAALHLALKAIGLKKDDEVILSTNTFVATAEIVTYFGAIPVLCDVEETTHNIDVLKIEPLITNKTKVIIPVHFAGQPCDMNEIYSLARKYNLKVIEDAAHAGPSSYKGVRIGALEGTDITCFSFYATKTLSTGEGGMATMNNSIYAKSMRVNRLHGMSRDAWNRYDGKGNWHYDVIDNGYKYNTTDINAVIGLVQLSKQGALMKKRFYIAQKYNSAFKKCKNITIPYIKSDRATSWHLYVIKVPQRDEVIKSITKKGVGCSMHFIPIHKHSFYRKKYRLKDSDYEMANKVFESSLSLPIYPDMRDEEIDYVINKVIEAVNNLKS